MKFFIQCPNCKFKISSEMKFSIEKEECPGCGNNFSMSKTLGVLQFLEITQKLNLPLTSKHLLSLIDEYFKKLPGFDDIPEIIIEETIADAIKNSSVKQVDINKNNVNNISDTSNVNDETNNVKDNVNNVQDKKQNEKSPRSAFFSYKDIKLTPEELKEVQSGLGIPPITKINDPNRGDEFSEKLPNGIKFVSKELLVKHKPSSTQIKDNQFEDEANEWKEGLENGPIDNSIGNNTVKNYDTIIRNIKLPRI